MMYSILLILASVFLSGLPSILNWRREKQLTDLSRARLKIAQSVTDMERLMLSGKLTNGDFSHDILFRLMQKIQQTQEYPASFFQFRKTSESTQRIKDALSRQVGNPDRETRKIVNAFVLAFVSAFFAKKPLLSTFCLFSFVATNLTLTGLLAILYTIGGLWKSGQTITAIHKEYLAECGAILLADDLKVGIA